LAFARRAGLMPAQVAMVGDSPHDMVAARAAGMIAVGLGGSTRDLQRLSVLADVILPDIAALPDWIDANR
jgi:phosphoglycolate phosphatase